MIYYLLDGKGKILKGTPNAGMAFAEASAKGYQVLQCNKAIDRVAYNKRRTGK